MIMNEAERIDAINNREDLARFVRDLSEDCQNDPNSWENHDLSSFLAALSGWIMDMDGYFINRNQPVPEIPSWKTLAQMLTAAKQYE